MSLFDNASVAKPNENSGAGFSVLEEGTYPAICYMLADVGTHENTYNGETKSQHSIYIGWEIPSEKITINGVEESRTIFKKYNISVDAESGGIKMYTTSALYKDLVAWRGQDFTEKEKEDFAISRLIGAPCLIQVKNTKSKDGSRTYNNVNGIMKMMKGMPAPVGTIEPIMYTIGGSDPNDAAKLPIFIGNLAKDSPEYEAALERKRTGGVVEPVMEEVQDEGDKLPF